MERELLKNEESICPNCEQATDLTTKYCGHCGQKNPKGMPTVWELLGDFISNFLNLDSKFFKTGRDIFVPGLLTKNFFHGIRGRYYAPFRLFIFSSFLFFGALSLTDLDEGMKKGIQMSGMQAYVKKINTLAVIDSNRQEVLKRIAPRDTTIARTIIDTLKHTIYHREDSDSTYFILFGKKEMKFSRKDAALLSPKEMTEKYHIENFWDRLAVQKFLKILKSPDKFILYLIGNIFWLLVVLIPLMALFMKLLYIRRKRFYIEHFVFLLHQHAFFFILGTILIGLLTLFPDSSLSGIIVGLFFLSLFISFLTFYKQGIFKTAVKFFIFSISYVIFGILVFTGVAIVSFAIF